MPVRNTHIHIMKLVMLTATEILSDEPFSYAVLHNACASLFVSPVSATIFSKRSFWCILPPALYICVFCLGKSPDSI